MRNEVEMKILAIVLPKRQIAFVRLYFRALVHKMSTGAKTGHFRHLNPYFRCVFRGEGRTPLWPSTLGEYRNGWRIRS